MLSKYSASMVFLIYFAILIGLNYQAVEFLAESEKGFVALFYALVVIQIGLGLIFAALSIDPSTGRNKN